MTPIATAFLCGFHPVPASHQPVYQASTQRMALPGEELEVRDVEGLPNRLDTEHFVLWWGDEFPDFPDLPVALAADLEASWDAQVDEMGWTRPVGSGTYKVNAYIGSSGNDGPEIDFAGGYVTLDEEGIPFVVISDDILYQYYRDPDSSLLLVQHEFNHLVQLGEPNLYETFRGQFYFEATANWMSAEVTGNLREYADWGGYLLQPMFSVHAFGDLFDDDDRRSGRQYLAALYVQFLADRYGADLIRQSWDEAPNAQDPLVWLDGAVDEDLRDVFVEFAVSHATGDHELAGTYASGAIQSGEAVQSVLEWLPEEGGAGEAVGRDRPEGSAWSRVVYASPAAATITYTFEGKEGTEGASPGFVNVAVVERDGGFQRTPFTDSVTLEVLENDLVHFVMVSVPEDYEDEERFGFSYTLEVEPDKKGCGCSTRSSASPSLMSWFARRRS